MKKYLLIVIAVLTIIVVVTAGFFLLKIGKTSPAAVPQTAIQPSAPVFSSFRGTLAGALSDLKNGISQVVSPAPASSATPSPSPFVQNTASVGSSDIGAFSFAIFGDSKEFSVGDPNGNLEKAVAQTKSMDLKAFFVMGDLIKSCDGGAKCTQSYNDWKSVMAPVLAKTYEVVGNHDRTGGDKADAVWQAEFSLPQNGPDGYKELAYSFDIGNSHFAVLDSEKPKGNIVNSVQRDWLDKDLVASSKEHKFVFYHEPAFQAAQDAEDGLDAQPAERVALWNIIKKYKVDAVFNGHAHIYARKKIDGIEQIVVGDTDSTDDDIVQPGLSDFGYKGKSYAIVAVNGSKINLKLFTVDGKQIESFDFN
ncbi:MAG: metallophosphoesterase [Candidatus Moranbacteria bacterium]|nr:metallophosphoesterase [Candidatus Moranbacteria bacterium]